MREQTQLWMNSQLNEMRPFAALLWISHYAGLFLQLNANEDVEVGNHLSGNGKHCVQFILNTCGLAQLVELGIKGLIRD